jgi:hypothetical protein
MTLLGIAAYFFFKDVPPPDDADFRPHWTEGGGPKNPLVTFIRGIKASAVWGHRPQPAYETGYSSVDNPELTEILSRNEFIFPLFDTLMVSDLATWRWHNANGALVSGVPEETYLCYEAAKILWGKAELHRLRSEPKEALDTSLNIHRFAHGLMMAEGNGFHHSVALQIQDIALGAIMRHLPNESSLVRLKEIQDKLGNYEPRNAYLATVLRNDYILIKPLVLDAADSSKEMYKVQFPRGRGYLRLWFQPNRTLREQLDVRRLMESDLDHDWRQACIRADASMLSNIHGARQWLAHPNSQGDDIMTDYMSWGLLDVVRNTSINLCKQRMVVTSLAIRCYEIERGSLPMSLHDLVPDFLPAAPVDPMHRLPIQWEPLKRELRVSRLIRRHPLHHGPSQEEDVVMKLWWKSGL